MSHSFIRIHKESVWKRKREKRGRGRNTEKVGWCEDRKTD